MRTKELVLLQSSIVSKLIMIAVVFVSLILFSGCSKSGGDQSNEAVKPKLHSSKKLTEASRVRFWDSLAWSCERYKFNSDALIPAGDGILQGKVTVDGSVRSNLKLQVLFKKNRHTSWVVSDSNGVFRIPVTRGTYEYVGFRLDKVSADNVLGGYVLSRPLSWGAKDPDCAKKIVVGKNQVAYVPDLEFIEPIRPIFPIDNGEVSTKKITFRWHPFPGVAYYQFQITDLGDLGSAVKPFFRSVDFPKVKGTFLSSDQLDVKFEDKHYYSWAVQGYSDTGQNLSHISMHQRPTLFRYVKPR